MKGIYLTQEGKQEIEAKIAELEYKKSLKSDDNNIWYFQGKIDDLKEMLTSATILPVEESWGVVEKQTNMMDEHQLRLIYDNGVIIQPKQ